MGAIKLGVVVLAAGRSSRMGRPKLVLPWGSTSVIGHIVRQWTSQGASQVAIVCAAGDEVMSAELDRIGFPAANRIGNPAPERGMFSSLQCAAAWSGWGPDLTHWAIVLGDQPHLRPATLTRLCEFGCSNPGRICQPSLAGRPRHPVLIPRRFFSRLTGSGCENLKEFLQGHRVALCGLDDPGLDLDIDNPEDYRRALGMLPGNT
ncbi:MAG TPA: nucleotidyltransferase family protein [Verrucomicrobiae bacterium]